MTDIALLMSGVLTTGQPSPPILPDQPLVDLYNGVENSIRGQLSQLVPTAQITPPEFMQLSGTILPGPSASTIEVNIDVQSDVKDTSRNTLNKISSKVDAKKFHQLSTESLPLTAVRGNTVPSERQISSLPLLSLSQAQENTATESFRPQQRSATKIADQPQVIDEQGVTKFQDLTSPLPILEFGDSGTSVRVLQRLLLFNGYTVEVDGVFGGLTEIAVSSFQYRRNLAIDGIVGQKTWDELAK